MTARGPDDEVTPVERDPYWRPQPATSPHPSPSASRDTSPPHPVASPRLDHPPDMPGEGRTPATFIVTAPYVKAKLEKMEQGAKSRRKRNTIGGSIIGLLVGALAAWREYHHDQVDKDTQAQTAQQQAATAQKLTDHIDLEAGHYAETTKRLDKLLDLELKRGERR